MKRIKLAADLHVHTVSSGHAYCTVLEYVRQAKKIGLNAFAVTDHGPNMPGAPHYYHFSNMKMIPEVIDGIRVYRGIEANVIDETGRTDVPTRELTFTKFEIVILSMHPRCGYESQSEEKNTAVLLKALANNPQVNILGHPGNPRYPVNVKEVVAAAKRHGAAIELNNSSGESREGSLERCVEFAREVKRQDARVVIGSDAHFVDMLGGSEYSLKIVKAAGLEEKHIINTSLKEVEEYLLRGRC